jgi:hypothetical protein
MGGPAGPLGDTMNWTFKKVLMVALLAIGAYFVIGILLKLVFNLALSLLSLLMPVLVVGGVVYVLYLVYGRKALGGSRRTLP